MCPQPILQLLGQNTVDAEIIMEGVPNSLYQKKKKKKKKKEG
jgi:hypothetical protein